MPDRARLRRWGEARSLHAVVWGELRRIRWPGESRLYYAACVVLIVLAAGLRFHDLPSTSLRHDEAVAATNTQGTISEVVGNTRNRNSSPILWPLGLWAIQKIESSHVSLRIVPAVASTLAVATLVFLLPRAGVRRSVAFLAGVLMAVSTAAIHEAQDVREYSIDVLLATILMTGALLYLKGEKKKKWILLVSMFLAPLLQYGLAIFGAAILVTITIRRWRDSEMGVSRKAFPLSFSTLPMIALAGGSILTWAITLRYHGTGFAKDRYLDAYYYQGEWTDVLAILQFFYHSLLDVLAYHVEVIPSGAVISVIIAAAVLSRKFRFSGTTILFLFAMVLGLLAAFTGLYPLGSTRQSLTLGPVIAVSFAHAVFVVAEVFLSRIPRISPGSPIVYRALSVVLSLAICTIGFSDVAKYRNVYADPERILPVLQLLEQQREDGDIVVWSPRARAALRYYEGSTPHWSRFCFSIQECMSILRELPDEVMRIWLAPYTYPYGTGLYGYDILAHVFDRNLVELKVDDTVSLRLIRDARLAANYLDTIEDDTDILENENNLIFQRSDFKIYMNNRSLLYTQEQTGNCDIVPFILHTYPLNQNDLPLPARKYGFANLDFRFEYYANYFAGKCVAVRFLPDYPLHRIRVGQYGEWSRFIDFDFSLGPADIDRDFLERLGAPIWEHGPWGVYRAERNIVYVTSCDDDRNMPTFFLHIYPVAVQDLPVESREYGFENRDFRFQDYSSVVGETCVVARPLPDYPIASIRTGQYDEAGKIWAADLVWESESPSGE